jgi:molybdopterin biosynthesis enzyme MoaB
MRPLIFACCLITGGCALTQDDGAARQPLAILDAYLVAHGMAASYVENPDADPAVKAQLVTLDLKARDAVRTLTHAGDGFADEDATARAVSALTDYAARQTSVAR